MAKVADFIELIVMDGDANATIFLWNNDKGAGEQRGRVLNEASSMVLVRDGFNRFGNNRIDVVRVGGDGRRAGWQ